jgi:hypothetical protein
MNTIKSESEFNTITGADWRRSLISARSSPNVVRMQIRERILAAQAAGRLEALIALLAVMAQLIWAEVQAAAVQMLRQEAMAVQAL